MLFFVNVVHRKPEKCGAKHVAVNGVNSNLLFVGSILKMYFILYCKWEKCYNINCNTILL